MRPELTRRAWLCCCSAFGGLLPLTRFTHGALALDAKAAIRQPNSVNDRAFMNRAFEMKRLASETGDQGYGAVVVRTGRIVGQAPSRVIVNNDPTGHAEMEAIRDASRRLGTRDLSGSTLYSSSRACPMCEAGAYWAGIAQMFFGQEVTQVGPPRLVRC